MITIEELSAYNRKLVDENLKLRKENENLKKRNSDEECLKRLAKKGYIKFCGKDNEWHKVADGDLPPEDTDVLTLLADKEIYIAHFYTRNVWDKIGPVIAWCEIPQYTEE